MQIYSSTLKSPDSKDVDYPLKTMKAQHKKEELMKWDSTPPPVIKNIQVKTRINVNSVDPLNPHKFLIHRAKHNLSKDYANPVKLLAD